MYIIIFSVVFFISILIVFDKRFEVISYISLFLICILQFLKGTAGVDFYTYNEIYKNINDYRYLEIGFRYLIEFLNMLSTSPRALFVFIPLFTLFTFLYIKKDNSIGVLVLFLLLVLTIPYSFNGIRQYFVICITFMICSDYVSKKLSNKKCLLLTVVAISIHSSGVLLLIFYFLKNKNLNYKLMLTLFFISVIIVISGASDLLINKILEIHGGSVAVVTYTEVFNKSIGYLSLIQKSAVTIVLIYIYIYAVKNRIKEVEIITNTALLGYIIFIFLSSYSMLGTRVYYFFVPFQLFSIAWFISTVGFKQRVIVYFISVALFFPGYYKDINVKLNKFDFYYEVNYGN